MEPATISALAALAGATIGGVTSFAATWLTQRTQARVQELTHSLTVREQLYKAFIKEASKLYADALVHEISDISKPCWTLRDDKRDARYFREEHGGRRRQSCSPDC